MILAHILGVPVEEYALPWVGGAGTGMFLLLAAGVRSITQKRRTR
jgi:hypothetical protein